MTEPADQKLPSDTQAQRVLVARMGSHWKVWEWLSNRFSTTSLASMAAIIAAGWGYIAHLNDKIATIKERVVVLETKVVPALSDPETKDRMDQIEARVSRIEDYWLYAENVVKTSPSVRLTKRKPRGQ